jgi:hypothetical protein
MPGSPARAPERRPHRLGHDWRVLFDLCAEQ